MADDMQLSPEFFNNLQNFGFGAMSASGTPGIPTLAALGQGGLAMNNAAQQRAQTQNVTAEAQGRQLQNQLTPLNIQYMKMRMEQAQKDQAEENQADGGGGAGMIHSATPNSGRPSQKPILRPANTGAAQTPTVMNLQPVTFKSAQAAGVDPFLFHGLLQSESNFDNNAVGDGGQAQGIGQLHPGAIQDVGGGNPKDATENIQMSAKYYKQNVDLAGGDPVLGMLSYKWGKGNFTNWKNAGADPSQIPPDEVEKVNKALGYATQAGYQMPEQQQQATSQAQPTQQSSMDLPPELRQQIKRLTRERNLTFDPAQQAKIDQDIASIYQNSPGYKKAGEQATALGKDTEESNKTLTAINSSIDTQIANLETLKKLSKRMPNRGPADMERFFSKHVGNQDLSSAWADFNTMNKQMFVNGLMGSIPAGSRLDIPIVKSLQVAKEVDPYTDAKSREEVINRHIETLKQAKLNAQKNYSYLNGDSKPSTIAPQDIAASTSPSEITHEWQPGKGIVPLVGK